jgi:hypothetical protein
MQMFVRLIIAAIICSAATVFVAGAMTWGFSDTSSRTGFVYHWLYSGPNFISGVVDEVSWLTMLVTYFTQYTLAFVLFLFIARAVRRRLEFQNQPKNMGKAATQPTGARAD